MIHVIIGTRACLIKMAPVMKEMDKRKIGYNYIFTGQHSKTIHELEKNFDIRKPNVLLYKGKEVSSMVYSVFWFAYILIKSIFHKGTIFNDKKGLILMHADNLSALYAAMIGKLIGFKVAHVESGLKSFSLFHPFPEEIIRSLVHLMTDYYYCQNQWAVNNMEKRHGVKINTKGNTIYDSLNLINENLTKIDIPIPKKKYGLISFHRFDNISTEERFLKIIKILENISKEIHLVFVLHPPTLNSLKKFKVYTKLKNNPNIELRDRYNYSRFVKLIINSEFMLTDSGSSHDECYYLGHPCLLLRKKTERIEGLGENITLSDLDEDEIYGFVHLCKNYQRGMKKFNESPSKIIIDDITRRLKL